MRIFGMLLTQRGERVLALLALIVFLIALMLVGTLELGADVCNDC